VSLEFVDSEDRVDGHPWPFAPEDGYGLFRPSEQRISPRRRDDRDFRAAPLPARQLGSVLSALADDDRGRSVPRSRPLLCYPLLLNVWHELSGRICRYEPASHALHEVGRCPRWRELAPVLGAAGEDPVPQFVLAFVLDDEPMMAKYGPRGRRFGLIESDAALRSVTLRMAAERLGGYLLGAAADPALLNLLGLTGVTTRLAAVLAGGLPAGGF
jgi:hypothetical protein